VGYKVSEISFANGEPTEPADSKTSTKDIIANPDNSVCPDKCFRPVGLARDAKGRIFMTSDATNDIWVLMKSESSGASSSSSTNTATNTATGTGASASPTKGAGVMESVNIALLATVLGFAVWLEYIW
jgi:hypothetical protein